MKLKYYMRGVGCGILFSMLLFLVIIKPNLKMDDKITSNANNSINTGSDISGLLGNNTTENETTPAPVVTDGAEDSNINTQDEPVITDEPVISDEPAVTDEHAFNDNSDDSTTTEPSDEPEKVVTPKPTPTPEPTATSTPTPEPTATSTPTPTPTATPTPTPKPTATPTPTPKPTATPTPTLKPTATPTPIGNDGGVAKAAITIKSNTKSQDFCKEAQKNGIVSDWNELNKYIIKNGYESKLRSGTYNLSSDMSFDEIVAIITRRK